MHASAFYSSVTGIQLSTLCLVPHLFVQGWLRVVANASMCLCLNRTRLPPEYIKPPCVWPSKPPGANASGVPFQQSPLLSDIMVMEDATPINGYGADTWYPAQDKAGNLYSGFDDGRIGTVSVGSMGPGFHTGSAIVRGSIWRNLSVAAVGGAIYENGAPMQGRYTCANAVQNGTWWVGTYGLAVGDGACEAGTGVLQFCVMGPFVGFRYSTNLGGNWTEPRDPTTGQPLTVAHTLFDEKVGSPIKLGAPHVVDFGPENIHSPDGALCKSPTR